MHQIRKKTYFDQKKLLKNLNLFLVRIAKNISISSRQIRNIVYLCIHFLKY